MKSINKALQLKRSIMQLSTAPVGTVVMIDNMKLKVSLTTEGCRECAFQTDEGARFCNYATFCFAQNRSDKKSVKFVKIG